MPPARPPRILVLRGGAIGDFILTLPALRALRDRWPDAYIELIGYPHIADLAVMDGVVDRVRSLDRAEMARFFAWEPVLDEAQTAFIRSFDMVLCYLHDPDGSLTENLKTAGARLLIGGSPLPQEGHAAEHLARPLETLALYGPHPPPSLRPDEARAASGKARLEALGAEHPLLVAHPGSGGARKNWPIDRWIELFKRADRMGLCTTIVLGEADADARAAILRACPERPRLEGLTLTDLAGALAHADAFCGHDSGITHLAAALGVPTLALFGPTDPERWGPRGPRVRCLRAPGGRLADLSVDVVVAEGLTSTVVPSQGVRRVTRGG